MRLQIDTTAKTIKIEQNIKLSELVNKLNALFPNNEWHKYTLETNTTINHWSTPIVIKDWVRPSYPWDTPFYSLGNKTVSDNRLLGNKTTVYNVEC